MRDALAGQRELRRRLMLAGAAGVAGWTLLQHRQALAAVVGGTAELGLAELPEGVLASQYLHALPGKLPLIKKTYRPPNFETPIEYFRTPITRNEAFFVRWHLAGIPQVNINQWVLSVGGESAGRERKFTMAELRKEFQPDEVTAVCLCSGNRRGLFEPHVPGVEWGVGAMGNATWKGVRLKDVLTSVGVKPDAIEVVFDGADQPVIDKTPDFIKSLPLDIALDKNTLIAFEMNGKPLPQLNGFPARLVVPGWTGTYWIKSLVGIRLVARPESNYWMGTAYRLPRGKFKMHSFMTQLKDASEPITTMVVNSLVTSLSSGQKIARGKPIVVKGLAWDGGTGIAKVEVSTDGGTSWQEAALGRELGRFSFREFSSSMPATQPGPRVVMARATNRAGETQVEQLIHNPPGYHHNVIQRIPVEVV